MKVIVCGGREYDDWAMFKSNMNYLLGRKIPEECLIIQGGAKGADFLARVWSKYYSFPCKEYPANWKKYGRRAGYIRNKQMLEEGKPDLVIAFPGGRGTADMVKQATEAGVDVVEIIDET